LKTPTDSAGTPVRFKVRLSGVDAFDPPNSAEDPENMETLEMDTVVCTLRSQQGGRGGGGEKESEREHLGLHNATLVDTSSQQAGWRQGRKVNCSRAVLTHTHLVGGN
jgi:hypothetical protein